MTVSEKLKMAALDWLAHRLPDCKAVTPLLGRSLDEPLSRWTRIILWLHRFTCEACSRYLSQIKFVRRAFQTQEKCLREKTSNSSTQLSAEAKLKIKQALRNL